MGGRWGGWGLRGWRVIDVGNSVLLGGLIGFLRVAIFFSLFPFSEALGLFGLLIILVLSFTSGLRALMMVHAKDGDRDVANSLLSLYQDRTVCMIRWIIDIYDGFFFFQIAIE